MIILDTTTRKIQAFLGGAVTTNQLNVTACYVDITTSTFVPGTKVTNTNNATAVDVAAAPAASTQRQVKYLDVYNADTTSATVTVQYDDNGTLYVLIQATLSAGQSLVYTDGAGWAVQTAAGGGGGGGTVTSITAGTGLSGGTITTSGTIALSTPVSVAHGGTGDATLTAHSVLLGEGTGNVAFATTGTAGQLLIDQGSGADPAFEPVSGSGATITMAANGLITISAIANASLAHSSVTVNSAGGITGGGSVALGSSITLSGLVPTGKTTTYTAAAGDLVLADATSAAFTVTLPAANTANGARVVVTKIDTGGNAVTVSRAGSDTLKGAGIASGGATTRLVRGEGDLYEFTSDGSATWYVTRREISASFTSAEASSQQSIANNTTTPCTLGTVVTDTDGQYFTSNANLTGTVSKTSGGSSITGSSTLFTSELSVGQVFSIPGGGGTDTVVVKSITDNTHLTVWAQTQPAFTATGQTATRVNSAIAVKRPGKYLLTAAMLYTPTGQAANREENSLRVNGATFVAYQDAVSANYEALTVGAPYDMAAGDYVEMALYQTSGVSVNTYDAVGTHSTLSVQRVSD